MASPTSTNLFVEIGFRAGFEQRGIERDAAGQRSCACLRMLLMRLKLAARGSKSSVGRTSLDGFEALFDIDQIVQPDARTAFTSSYLKAANFAEVVADAVEEEFFELRVAVAEGLNRQAQFAFDENLDDALRGAAERERIFRAGGNQADAESSRGGCRACRRWRASWPARVRGIESSMLTGL